MAERLHKSLSAYYRMEAGEVKIDAEEIPAILKALNDCTLEEFFKDIATINIQQHNEKVYAQNVNHQVNALEDLLKQFQLLMQNMLSFFEKSEVRSERFIQEMTAQFKDIASKQENV